MDDRRRLFLRTTSALLLLAQFAGAAPVLAAVAPAGSKPAATSAKPSALVARAQGYYRDARYDEAVGLLAGPILRKELAGDELRDARLVMARCYVKKGITTRAKEYFGAILAADPALTAEQAKLDDEELAVFNAVKGVSAPPASQPVATKPAPEGKTPPAKPPVEKPALHKPAPVASSGAAQPGWLARNKFLAIGIVVGGGVAAGLAMGGGGGGTTTPPGPTNLPGFPQVPGGH
jgi:hypothetical protein